MLVLATPFAAAQNVRFAEKFSGADAGEKINACIAALPPSGGVCDARGLSGEQHAKSALQIGTPTKPVQLLLGSVALTVSNTVTVESRSSITGMPSGQAIGSFNGPTLIRAAEKSHLPTVLQLTGKIAVLQDITVDGNRVQNPDAGVGLSITGWRADLTRVSVQNSPGHGIVIQSDKGNEACCAKLEKVMAIANGKSGLYVRRTGDVMVLMSEFENNGTNGVELDSSSGLRIEQSDLGGNHQNGLFMYGTPDAPSAYAIIVGNQFGNNYLADIEVEGSKDRYSSIGHLISGNEFIGSGNRAAGKADGVHMVDSAYNVVTNNSFFAGPGHPYRSCVALTGWREKKDVISQNYCHTDQVHGPAGFLGAQDTIFDSNQGSTARTKGPVQ